MSYQRSSLRTRLPGAVAIGVAVALGVYVMAFLVLASSRDRLVEEDGIIETTTALVFLGAALIGTIAMLTTDARRLYWLVPAFGLFGFLDEMSFGARILGFPLPVIDGLEVDSFHDIFDLADRFAGDLGISRTMIALLLVSVAVLTATYLLRTGRIRHIPVWLSHHRPILLLVAALGLLFLGVALDLIGSSTTARFAEETAEFAASGLVAIAAADLLRPRSQSVPKTQVGSTGEQR